MTGAPLDASAAAAWSSRVDLPMPGSPPTRTAEPGTRPPPSTRSNSAMPVGSRGASRVSVCRPSKEAALRLPPLIATRAGGSRGLLDDAVPFPAGRACAGPARGHCPTGLADKGFGGFGHDVLLAAQIEAQSAGPEIGENLVVDGASVGGKLVGRDILADQLDPSVALGNHLGHIGHIDGDEIHGHAAEQRRRMGFKVDLQALLAIAGRQRTEDAVGIPDREDGDARRSLKRPRCAIADG